MKRNWTIAAQKYRRQERFLVDPTRFYDRAHRPRTDWKLEFDRLAAKISYLKSRNEALEDALSRRARYQKDRLLELEAALAGGSA